MQFLKEQPTLSDEPFYSPNAKPPPPRVARPGELLFEFIRASDGALMSCELRFQGESYGWEAQFLVRGELFTSHGAFVARAEAVRWADERTEGDRAEPSLIVTRAGHSGI